MNTQTITKALLAVVASSMLMIGQPASALAHGFTGGFGGGGFYGMAGGGGVAGHFAGGGEGFGFFHHHGKTQKEATPAASPLSTNVTGQN